MKLNRQEVASILEKAHKHYYDSDKDFASVYYAQADYLEQNGFILAIDKCCDTCEWDDGHGCDCTEECDLSFKHWKSKIKF